MTEPDHMNQHSESAGSTSQPIDKTSSSRTYLNETEMIALVRRHVETELRHDWEGVAATMSEEGGFLQFGSTNVRGRKGIASYYRFLFSGVSDANSEEEDIFCIGNKIFVQGVISGRHTGFSLGLPLTGRTFRVPIFAVFEVAADGTLAYEKGYFDSASVLHDMGFKFHPMNPINILLVYAELLIHPITLLRILGHAARRLVGRP